MGWTSELRLPALDHDSIFRHCDSSCICRELAASRLWISGGFIADVRYCYGEMMPTLAEYTARRGTRKRVAMDAGLCALHVGRIANGEMHASIEAAVMIEQATKGEVRAETMISQKSQAALTYLRGQA